MMPVNGTGDRVGPYLSEALDAAGRLLGLMDRQPESPTYGEFDRDHWAWKLRDFPLGMLQSSLYPLALLWRWDLPRNPYVRNPRLLDWILAGLTRTLDRQRRNGSFDAFCPHENDPGVTLGVLHGLLETHRLVQHAPACAGIAARLRQATVRGCDYAYPWQERHGFISNHLALFAVAFLDAHELTGDERYRRKAHEIVSRIVARQSPDGWYDEYGGPDPGYESLGIFHLAAFWRRAGDRHLLESLAKSVGFFAHCVHPDGSIGGSYGSRHTALYFPGGFEILAPSVPLAAAVASFMAARLARRNVLTPAWSDAENLPPLTYSYIEAAIAAAGQPRGALVAPRLPCEELHGVRAFTASGLVFAGTSRYYAAVNGSKGGVCRVFDRRSSELAYEDAGYTVSAGGRVWGSQVPGLGAPPTCPAPDRMECRARFGEVWSAGVTPVTWIVLRLLNLTVYRSRAVANGLRRLIVRRLITRTRPGPFTLRRDIRFDEAAVHIADELEASGSPGVDGIRLTRTFTPLHMGSARYFHPNELHGDDVALPADLGRRLAARETARNHTTIAFDAEPSARTTAAAAYLTREAASRSAR